MDLRFHLMSFKTAFLPAHRKTRSKKHGDRSKWSKEVKMARDGPMRGDDTDSGAVVMVVHVIQRSSTRGGGDNEGMKGEESN